MSVDEAYLALLEKALLKGDLKSNRTGVDTYSLFADHIEVPVAWNDFPLLTTKKMPFNSIFAELLWFLRGYTDNAYLRMHDCTIWNEWATAEQCAKRDTYEGDLGPTYGHQWRHFGPWTEGTGPEAVDTRDMDTSPYRPRDVEAEPTTWMHPSVQTALRSEYLRLKDRMPLCKRWQMGDEFVFDMSVQPGFREYAQDIILGRPARFQLGVINGKYTANPSNVRFRLFGSTEYAPPVDQIESVIRTLRFDSDSRRMVVSAWNPTDLPNMALSPCHMSFQVYANTQDGLDMHVYQRSADIFLGVPFNIASYALLLLLIKTAVHREGPSKLRISFGDVHLYKNHVDAALTQLRRAPKGPVGLGQQYELYQACGQPERALPHFHDLRMKSVYVNKYASHPPIKADVAV